MKLPLPVAQLFLSTLNHLLASQPVHADALRRYAGRHLRIRVDAPADLPGLRTLGAMAADARIDDDGLLVVVSADKPPAVTLTVTPTFDALLRLLREGSAGLSGSLRIEGDVMLAAALGQVAKALRWDYEEDLSRVVGDIAAHRVGEGLRGASRDLRGLRDRTRDAWRRIANEPEAPVLAREPFEAFREELAAVGAAVAALEMRLSR